MRAHRAGAVDVVLRAQTGASGGSAIDEASRRKIHGEALLWGFTNDRMAEEKAQGKLYLPSTQELAAELRQEKEILEREQRLSKDIPLLGDSRSRKLKK